MSFWPEPCCSAEPSTVANSLGRKSRQWERNPEVAKFVAFTICLQGTFCTTPSTRASCSKLHWKKLPLPCSWQIWYGCSINCFVKLLECSHVKKYSEVTKKDTKTQNFGPLLGGYPKNKILGQCKNEKQRCLGVCQQCKKAAIIRWQCNKGSEVGAKKKQQ